MKPLVSIVIINYNGKHFLQSCISSLLAQTHKQLEIIFIDNLSQDGSLQYVQENFPKIIAIGNDRNIGYSEAGNQGIKMATGKYIMLLNPDIIFEKPYIQKCILKMEEDHRIAAICGKIYKYDFEKKEKTNLIDTVGLFCYRDRRVIDNGQGLEDIGQFNRSKEVFGISGACPIYRKSALDDVKIGDEYLDKDFFMYKEDVDISWRFHLYGWKCYYLHTAVANHGRGTGVLQRFSHLEVAKKRSKLSEFQKFYSYKNQRLMQVKNEMLLSLLHDLPWILWKEILSFGFILIREPFLLKSWLKMWEQVPVMLKKRRQIMKHKRIHWQEMEHWIGGKQSEYV